MTATDIATYAAIAYASINGAATIITIITPNPDPNTPLGKAYRILEVLAGLLGHAKDTGAPKP